ncbi:hypothetical protein AAGY25_14120 [Staphylococcus aureus]
MKNYYHLLSFDDDLANDAEQSSHSYSLKSRLKPYLLLRYAYLLKGSVAKLKNKCLTLCLK